MNKETKIEVLNPISLFNTVGQEVEEILSARKKNRVEFLEYMGWRGRELFEIKAFSKSDINKIAKYLNIDGLDSYIKKFQQDYKEKAKESEKSYKESKALYKKFKKLPSELYHDFKDGIDILADISNFFGMEDEADILNEANRTVALYRTPSFNPDSINLFAWMRRGELDFHKLSLPLYNRSDFESWINREEWRNHLEDEAYFKKLPEVFMTFGVGLVFTTYLEKTVYGAVRWFDGKPLVQISDRDKSIATCWHTLFHEIGHVLLHENATIFEGEIESKTNATKREREANGYAYKKLFNGDELRKYIFSNAKYFAEDAFIEQTASQYNVPVIFVAYWMLKAQINPYLAKSYIPSITF